MKEHYESEVSRIRPDKAKGIICICAAAADLALFLIKLYVAISSNSISIYVDSLNSLADTLVCIIAVIGFYVASGKPNEKYPFGYGRTEEIVNFLLSLVILFTGLAFVYSSLQRLVYPVPVWYSGKYAVLIAATAAVKLVMAFGFGAAHRKYGSSVLRSMRTDSILDFFISACIVVSFTLTQKLGYSIDSLMGLAASTVIVINGIRSLASTLGSLVGKTDKDALGQAKKKIAEAGLSEYVMQIGIHSYGERKIINVQLDCDSLSPDEAAEAAQKIQKIFRKDIYINSGGNNYE